MDDLVAFVEARLAADEQLARAAMMSMSDTGEWQAYIGNGLAAVKERGYYIVAADLADETAQHIACHDPARVLRDVEAKRQMLRYVRGELADDETDQSALWLLQMLAAPFADHPDFRPEWNTEEGTDG